MALRRKREVFAPTDGVLSLCRETPGRRARGIDWTGDAGLEAVCELPYRKSKVRAVDAQLMGDDAQATTLKVCVRRPPALPTTSTVVVGGRAHDVTRVDEDGRLAWLYLTELNAAGTCELVSTTTTYDELGLPVTSKARQAVLVRKVEHGTEAEGTGSLATLSVTIRSCDWAGERKVVMGGLVHSVRKVTGDGAWTTLTCAEGAVDVGQA